MGTQIVSRTRKWLGVSTLAVTIALAGGAGIMLTSHQAVAQVSVTATAPVSFADLVEAVKPAVVSIKVDGLENVTRRRGRGGNGFNFDFPDLPDDHPFRRFFEQFEDERNGRDGAQAPRQRRFQAAGSGFIISQDGLVVTNNHVVERADKVTVVNDAGEEFEAEVIGTDPRTDLALLKIKDASGLTYVELADEEVRVGDWVVAVGNPFGLGGTVTAGIVSARGRDISAQSYGDYIQIDAAVNRGNSGGPAFNLNGKVVGVNTAIFSPNGGSVGIAFAIPAATVKQIINDLMDDGLVTRGFLGVSIQDVTKDIAESVGLSPASGALVTQPSDGSPAKRAGIRSGDIIIAVDGEEIDSAKDLSRTIAQKNPGTIVELTLWRNGAEKTVQVTLDTLSDKVVAIEEPKDEPAPEMDVPVPSSVGLVLVPNGDGDGLLVQDIEEDSVAATKGFAIGDLILEANNSAVDTAEAFEAAIDEVKQSGRATILIKASRDGNVRFIGLPLEAR